MAKINWTLHQTNKDKAKEIADSYNIHYLFVQLLMNRGLSEDEIVAIILNDLNYLNAPDTLVNAEKAALEIATFINKNPDGLIIVQADYDCDGITSGYIMGHPLAQLHDNVVVKYPERSEGYGLQMAFCEKIVSHSDCPKLVITVDNGIAAINEVQYLVDNGVKVVITDHHTPKEILPNCTIVDPHCYEGDPNKGLAGCGVAFKVVQLLLKHFPDVHYDISDLLPILAIGTIADMMPITLDNLFYIRNGLAIINSDDCPNSIKAFKEFCGIEEIVPNDIGWKIGPALNACGRMGNILLAANYIYAHEDTKTIMDEYVAPIIKTNELRKERTKELLEISLKQVKENSLVNFILLKECEEGLAGIVANKVMETNNKPTIILVDCGTHAVGSARTPNGLSILQLLNASAEFVDRFGGHDNAAGLTVSIENLDALEHKLNTVLTEAIISLLDTETDTSVEDELDMFIDFSIDLKDLDKDTLSIINSLPYDNANFNAPIVMLETTIKHIKPTQKDPNNVWLGLIDGYIQKEFWVKDGAALFNGCKPGSKVRLIGTLKENFMKSKSTPVIVDILDVEIAN